MEAIDVGLLRRALQKVICSEDPLFVSDSAPLCHDLAGLGLRTLTYRQIYEGAGTPGTRDAVVIIPTSLASAIDPNIAEDWFGRSRLFGIPIASFGATDLEAKYALDAISRVDFEDAVQGSLDLMNMLEQAQGSIEIVSPDARCTLVLNNDICVLQPKLELETMKGEWTSPSDYLELGLIPRPGTFEPCHSLNGELTATGVAVAAHKYFWQEVQPLADRAWKILRSCRNNGDFPLSVHLSDSRVTHVITRSGRDLFEELILLVDRAAEGAVAELAFASLSRASREIDWSMNSPLNEAAAGLHVALGSGLKGAHIDFISTDARLSWHDAAGEAHQYPRAAVDSEPLTCSSGVVG